MRHEIKNTSVHPCALSLKQLRKCINCIIDVSCRIKEVPYVTALVQVLPLVLRKCNLLKYSDGGKTYSLHLTSTLIHGRPLARPKHGKYACELGDMMIVCRDDTVNSQSAVILQAKVSRGKEASIKLSNDSSLNQLDLYTNWPIFSIDGNGYKSYDLYPKIADKRAQHMILRHWQRPNIMIAESQKTMPIQYPSFGVFLMQMLKLKNGREFFTPPEGDAWSELIEDVQRYVASSPTINCKALDSCKPLFPRVASTELVFHDLLSNEEIDIVAAIENVTTRIIEGISQSRKGFIDDSNCCGMLLIEKRSIDSVSMEV